MKVAVLQEYLHRGLQSVAPLATTHNFVAPLTSNVLIVAEGSRLKLVATNMETAITCWLGAKVETEGAITVPARLLAGLVASLPPEKIILSQEVGNVLHLKSGPSQFHLNGSDARDFPPIPRVEGGIAAEVEVKPLCQGIARTVFAAAAEESRPVLTGVNARFNAGLLTLAGADGFRLAVDKLPLAQPVVQPAEAIIPAAALAQVERLAGEQNDPVTIRVDKNYAHFSLQNIGLVTRLIEGTYPAYPNLIPQKYQTRALFSTAEMLTSLRSALVLASKGSNVIRLMMTPGEISAPGRLAVSTHVEETGDSETVLEALIEGEEARIAFNAKYLIQALETLGEPQAVLEVTTPSAPGVIRPAGSDSYIYVLMPLFVQW